MVCKRTVNGYDFTEDPYENGIEISGFTNHIDNASDHFSLLLAIC